MKEPVGCVNVGAVPLTELSRYGMAPVESLVYVPYPVIPLLKASCSQMSLVPVNPEKLAPVQEAQDEEVTFVAI